MADKSKGGTSCKDAIARWVAAETARLEKAHPEQKVSIIPAEAKHVQLICMNIKKMDSALNTLVSCEHLALSTNCIDKMVPLTGLKRLKILSLGRNLIRKIEKLDEYSGTLEQLWLSYNQIEKLDGLGEMKQLEVLYVSNNKIQNIDEVSKLKDLPKLRELLLLGNPLCSTPNYRSEIKKRLPRLQILDGRPTDDD